MQREMYLFMVIPRFSKKQIPEMWELRNVDNPTWPKDLKTFMVFKSHQTAMRWVNYWREGKKHYIVVKVNVKFNSLNERK